MLRSYLSFVVKLARKNGLLFSLNILGLAVAMACMIVLFIFVKRESTYERDYEDNNRIYRIATGFFNMRPFAPSQEHLGDYLIKEFHGVENYTAFQVNPEEFIWSEDELFKESAFYIDSNYFKVFSGEHINHFYHKSLSPYEVVISEALALKLFDS